MITILRKIFLKDTMSAAEQRSRLGGICGGLGIFLNVLLSAAKLSAGIVTGSIAIMADGFNNLSDAGSSVVTLIGFALAGQKPDRDHPYGHGRIEYISGMVVSFLILIMGYELFTQSVKKIIHPEQADYSPLVLVILVASILVKCYMAFYNTRVGKEINSLAILANAKDSLFDCVATAVVLGSTLLSHFYGISADGWAGIVVAAFILYGGFGSLKDMVDVLIGQKADPEYLDSIREFTENFDENIIGVHDIMVHDYGPGRKIVSLHAEVPAEGSILELHDVIDNAEKALGREFGCMTTIHMDPVVTTNPEIDHLREKVGELVKAINPECTIHDFRMVPGDTHTNLIFDTVVPFSDPHSAGEFKQELQQLVTEKIGPQYFVVVDIDKI